MGHGRMFFTLRWPTQTAVRLAESVEFWRVLSFGNPLSVEFRYVGLSYDLVRTVFVGVLWVLCCLYYMYYLLVILQFLYEKNYALRCNPGSVSI